MRNSLHKFKPIRMKLQNRFILLEQLKKYLLQNGSEWQEAKEKAFRANGWFVPEFIDLAVKNIVEEMLDDEKLKAWVDHYHFDNSIRPKNVGLVMAGNIPLVGFHDFLCCFVGGHIQTIKPSSRDEILLKHLVQQMYGWDSSMQELVSFAPMLKGCDAYIATGSNNSATFFDYYFSRYPSIIRRNRTSVAVLKGDESPAKLEKLSDDIHQFFGLGCRNVTKIFVPRGYDFIPLLQSFHRYKYFADHHKYRNNYDYNLSLHILNNRFYMTNDTVLLAENDSLFSPISQLNYSYYDDEAELLASLRQDADVQCIAGPDIPFGKAQSPALMNYADGVDTMQFLLSL